MTTLTYRPRTATALVDTWVMLRRNLLHARRYPAMTISISVMPSLLLVVFNYVFGGALEAGLGDDVEYIDYLAPGMLLVIPAYMLVSVAVSITTDTTKGIVNRFRTMSINQSAVLAGHVFGAMVQALLALAVMLGVAVLMGFRPDATPSEWLALVGLLVVVIFALNWLAVGFGLVAQNPESASNLPFPIVMMPFLGSGLVPTDTMPTVLRWFAEYQPFTPLTETVRGLLTGTAIGNNAVISLVWCAGITVVAFVWSASAFRKKND